ncbi:MAG TPA: biotin carboxylase N-terminal domain-containing protein, partial [Ktedonobacterales bacterium]|nr:biotin carboxylase N-terminal domain-containing protein [Ktedonobacterales bacterium]
MRCEWLALAALSRRGVRVWLAAHGQGRWYTGGRLRFLPGGVASAPTAINYCVSATPTSLPETTMSSKNVRHTARAPQGEERFPFTTVLIANRGEIALRIIRACRDLGLRSVAVYSDADRESPHVRLADEAVRLGPAPASESYLSIEKIIAAAQATGAQAIHPGYGFLSENPVFADACEAAGITFVGPSARVMREMGEKTAARRKAQAAHVPVTPGYDTGLESAAQALEMAERIGYPVLLKAAAGGGGKGIRFVHRPEDLEASLRLAQSEAQSSFGDPTVYIEKAVAPARHIEVQLFGDNFGNVIHLGERE